MSLLKVVSNPGPHEPPFVLSGAHPVVRKVFEFLRLYSLRGMSRKTIRAYAYDLLAFCRFLESSGLDEIERLSSESFTDFLLIQRKHNAAPRTINRRLTVVLSFLNSQYDGLGEKIFKQSCPAFYRGSRNRALLGKSALKRKKKKFTVKVPSIIITPLNPTEVKNFLVGLRKYRDLAIVTLMLFCGLRSSEVLALETNDIDFIDDQLRVRGKGLKERILPMSPSVRKTLMHYLDYERPHCDHNRCFVALKGTSRGRPMTEAALRKLFRDRRKKSVNRACPHLFRHSFCTSLITRGVSLPVVQKLMGHTDISVTMLYTHLSLDDVAREYHQAMKTLESSYEPETASENKTLS